MHNSLAFKEPVNLSDFEELLNYFVEPPEEIPPHYQPEQWFWLHVLMDACQGIFASPARLTRQEWLDDKAWLMNSVGKDVGSFLWICEQIDIDSNRLRERLRAEWKRIRQRKIKAKSKSPRKAKIII